MKASQIIVLVMSSLLVGCASSNKTFYWGDYSTTLYHMKETADEKYLGEHKKELLRIMDESSKRDKKVPPGVYAEYGYILLGEGNDREGMEYLDREVALYPEAVVFIQRVKNEHTRGNK